MRKCLTASARRSDSAWLVAALGVGVSAEHEDRARKLAAGQRGIDLLAGPPDQIGPGRPPDEPGAKDPADLAAEALETLGREVAGALRRFGDLLESGDWRRFLGG